MTRFKHPDETDIPTRLEYSAAVAVLQLNGVAYKAPIIAIGGGAYRDVQAINTLKEGGYFDIFLMNQQAPDTSTGYRKSCFEDIGSVRNALEEYAEKSTVLALYTDSIKTGESLRSGIAALSELGMLNFKEVLVVATRDFFSACGREGRIANYPIITIAEREFIPPGDAMELIPHPSYTEKEEFWFSILSRRDLSVDEALGDYVIDDIASIPVCNPGGQYVE